MEKENPKIDNNIKKNSKKKKSRRIDDLSLDKSELKNIDKYVGIIHFIINKLRKKQHDYHPIDKEDLFQYGMIALLKAFKTFDANKGKFSSYAYRIIHNDLINYLLINRSLIKIPYWVNKKTIRDEDNYSNVKNPVSLNTFINSSNIEGKIEYIDTLEDRSVVDMDKRLYIEEAISTLSPKKRDILYKKLYYNKTFKEIGFEMNISKQRVQQIYKEMLMELKLKLS